MKRTTVRAEKSTVDGRSTDPSESTSSCVPMHPSIVQADRYTKDVRQVAGQACRAPARMYVRAVDSGSRGKSNRGCDARRGSLSRH